MTLASLTFRTRYGTAAVYIKSDLNHTEIWYDVEITVTVLRHPVLMWWVSTGQKLVEFHN